MPKELLIPFIQGVIEGDGNINKSGIRIFSASHTFVIGLHNLLNRCGIHNYFISQKAKTSKQIASILKRYHKDRDKDKWFTENNFKLIRITDTQFSSNAETCISKIIQ